MDTVVKVPAKCTQDELNAFQNLVEEGGEVTPHGLRQRIEQAEALVFINDIKCVAVGAIKNPYQSYKTRVFSKAGVAKKSTNYKYELGWLYVSPEARDKGHGHNLMQAVTEFVGKSGCFATTRENNDSMHHLFSQYSFNKLGKAYPSNNGYSLVLYGNRP